MNYNLSYTVFIICLILFVSCEKENIDTAVIEEEEIVPEIVSCNLSLSIVQDSSGLLTANLSNGTAPFYYQWSTGESEKAIVAKESGIYELSITDGAGCIANASIEVDITELCTNFTAEIYGNLALYDTLAVNLIGGTPPYTFQWTTGEETNSIIPKEYSVYEVLITDSEGCITKDSVIIDHTENCNSLGATFELNNAGTTLTAVGFGGTPPYLYQWSTGESEPTITVESGTTYLVVVIDANYCFVEVYFEVP